MACSHQTPLQSSCHIVIIARHEYDVWHTFNTIHIVPGLTITGAVIYYKRIHESIFSWTADYICTTLIAHTVVRHMMYAIYLIIYIHHSGVPGISNNRTSTIHVPWPNVYLSP